MPWITKEGRTVEEAQDAAIAAAGVPADELEIEIVSEGAKGLFGLGGEPAVVRVRAREEATDFRHAFRDDITPAGDEEATRAMPAPSATAEDEEAEPADQDDATAEDKLSLSEQQQQAADLGTEIVKGILEKMGLEGEVNTRVAGGTVYVEVFGDEMGILIGRGGATLEALQELVRAGVQRRLKTRQALVVDVEAYWERRRTTRRRDDGEERRRGPRGERRGGRGGDGRRERDGNR
jgi:spoIIIJ-associated protein